MSIKRILFIGGYGNFGRRIVEHFSANPDLTLFIAGRSLSKAESLVGKLQPTALAALNPIQIDIKKEDVMSQLSRAMPDIVIHTGGPFQGQDHRVPEACIAIGAHYIDLADDRRFVCDIKKLDEHAKEKKVLVVSGASSVPGLSSAVIDHYASLFDTISEINVSIAPGNKSERGEATIRGILSYTGKRFLVFKNGFWISAYGWMDPRHLDFGGIIGKRWMANVNVPDLELFPDRYNVAGAVRFQASLELPFLHLTMVGMAALAKWHLIRNWSGMTRPIIHTSKLFKSFGTDKGAMQVEIKGSDTEGKYKQVKWTLHALNGVGPYIPTLSAVIVAEKLISGELNTVGATPCLGLYSMSDFKPYADDLGIYFDECVSG